MNRRPPAESIDEKITLKGAPLERVDKFKYLGSEVTSSGDFIQDISIRTCAALQAISSLNKIWCSRKCNARYDFTTP